MVRDLFAPIVLASGIVDRVYEFRRGAGPVAFWKLLSEIRRNRFDQDPIVPFEKNISFFPA